MLTLLRTGRPDVTVSRTANYKTARQLTKEDLDMIEMDRSCSGIRNYSDEYYYNNLLYSNVNKTYA